MAVHVGVARAGGMEGGKVCSEAEAAYDQKHLLAIYAAHGCGDMT